jgi:hypothetical protein
MAVLPVNDYRRLLSERGYKAVEEQIEAAAQPENPAAPWFPPIEDNPTKLR